MLNTWIAGPSKGLLASARNGDIPKIFARTNKHNAPTTILTAQAIIVSIFALFYLCIPNINITYWVITAISGMTALFMNILLFSSVIILRYKAPDQERPYKMPGGMVGAWIIAGVGVLVCMLGIVLAFIPPKILHTSYHFYDALLIIVLVVLTVPAFFIHKPKKL